MTQNTNIREENGLILIEVAHNKSWFATFSLLGAQLLSYHSFDEGTEMFWLDRKTPDSPGKPWRGGVPIVFPWFGLAKTDGSLPEHSPQHGFARYLPWRFLGAEITSSENDGKDETVVRFILNDSPMTRVFWNHSFELELIVRLRPQMISQELVVRNTGEERFDFELLLHPYFLLNDIQKSEVQGLDGAEYYDNVQVRNSKQSGAVSFPSAVDLVCQDTGPDYEITEDGKTTIRVSKSGSTETVVWNPGPGNYPGATAPPFVCVEPGCVRESPLSLKAGESHSMTGIWQKLS